MSELPEREKTAAKHMYWARSASLTPAVDAPTPKKIDSTSSTTSTTAADDTMWCPLYKWGQTRDKVVVTVFVPCVRDDAVTIEITPGAVDFRAERIASFAGDAQVQRNYKLHLALREEVDVAAQGRGAVARGAADAGRSDLAAAGDGVGLLAEERQRHVHQALRREERRHGRRRRRRR